MGIDVIRSFSSVTDDGYTLLGCDAVSVGD